MPEIISYLHQLEEQYQNPCIQLHNFFLEYCADAKWSSHNHQTRSGGYFDHIREILFYAHMLYPLYNKIQKLPFSLADAYLVLFLHDIEKPIKYTKNKDPQVLQLQGENNDAIRQNILQKFNIPLEEKHRHALKYIHGEGDDYSSTHRVMSPLGAFCHICDITSARIFFDKIEIKEKII